ncbi:hypothetical protein F4803DRAFT_556195 [Xylaria telfairii]|nr:hypothetical protein F4803DRAFT_556195 [Xylaria telfairii]
MGHSISHCLPVPLSHLQFIHIHTSPVNSVFAPPTSFIVQHRKLSINTTSANVTLRLYLPKDNIFTMDKTFLYLPGKGPSTNGYCSEDEDQPREIFDTNSLFIYGQHPEEIVLPLSEIRRLPRLNPNLVRPRPSLSALLNTQLTMSFSRPVPLHKGWTLSHFCDIRAMDQMFTPRFVRTLGQSHNRRFCLRRRFAQTELGFKTMLIQTNAFCRPGFDSAGCAFKFSDLPGDIVAFRLEKNGPDGTRHEPTHERASFRAVLAALNFKDWYREGWAHVVVSTPLSWMNELMRDEDGPFPDLRAEMFSTLHRYADSGCQVSFSPPPDTFAEKANFVMARLMEYQTIVENQVQFENDMPV